MKVPCTLQEWYEAVSTTKGEQTAMYLLSLVGPFMTGNRFQVVIGEIPCRITIRSWMMCARTHKLHAEIVYSHRLVNKYSQSHVLPLENIKYISTLIMSKATG